jgi:hypothetical protein
MSEDKVTPAKKTTYLKKPWPNLTILRDSKPE